MAKKKHSVDETEQAVLVADPALSPPVSRSRANQLEQVKDNTLSEALIILRDHFDKQRSETGRLGNLAAQTWVVRRRLEAFQEGDLTSTVDEVINGPPEPVDKLKLLALKGDKAGTAEGEDAADAAQKNPSEWQKVRIIEEVEVNKMLFFAGSIVAVSGADAERLVESNKAEIVAGDPEGEESPDEGDVEATPADDSVGDAEEGDADENTNPKKKAASKKKASSKKKSEKEDVSSSDTDASDNAEPEVSEDAEGGDEAEPETEEEDASK